MDDGVELQVRSGMRRSSSSEPLLESPPSSHCVAAAAGGEEATAATAAYRHGEDQEEIVKEKAAMVASQEKAKLPTVVARRFDGHGSSEGMESTKGEASSPEVGEEHDERKRNKGKQKKRWSWLPDPEKRWPVQGW